MQTGIIGLPQVGKTSLFRILTGVRVDAKTQPGQMHVGIARVPDARIVKLAELFKPKKITYATVEYVDIGGLQKDRAKDSASLVPLREADALMHVVRLFEDPSMPHPAGSLDALRDIESVEIELMLNDLEQATKRLERVEKDLKKKKDPLVEAEKNVLDRCIKALESETPLRELDFKPDELKIVNGFMFVAQTDALRAESGRRRSGGHARRGGAAQFVEARGKDANGRRGILRQSGIGAGRFERRRSERVDERVRPHRARTRPPAPRKLRIAGPDFVSDMRRARMPRVDDSARNFQIGRA